MITKFENFNYNENEEYFRILSDEELIELYKKNCTQHSWKKSQIYRSVSAFKENYFLNPNEAFFNNTYTQDGKKYRIGAYAEYPYYNLLINHDPSWSDFPKRQLICSTNTSLIYGSNFYLIIPYDNARL